ncbi:MAG: protein kinase [Myxococcales bacterium]|nr:protein kinase [Myxococcales bacterium]
MTEPVAHRPKAPRRLADLVPGARFQDWEIVRPLGAGGQAVVYLARHVLLDRLDVLKFQRDLAADDVARARLRDEAKLLAVLGMHPNLPSVYTMSLSEEGRIFIALEYLEGKDLRDILGFYRRLEPVDAVYIGAEACRALAAAHRHGIVHRDLKPENVFVCRARRPSEGTGGKARVRVLDFGAALLVGSARRTREGLVVGTATYMAPEQAGGEVVDARADLYALGAILWECLVGRILFTREGERPTPQEMVLAHLGREPERVSDLCPEVPRWLSDLVARCLAKRPIERFASAEELGSLLRGGLARLLERGAKSRLSVDKDPRTQPQPEAVVAPPSSGGAAGAEGADGGGANGARLRVVGPPTDAPVPVTPATATRYLGAAAEPAAAEPEAPRTVIVGTLPFDTTAAERAHVGSPGSPHPMDGRLFTERMPTEAPAESPAPQPPAPVPAPAPERMAAVERNLTPTAPPVPAPGPLPAAPARAPHAESAPAPRYAEVFPQLVVARSTDPSLPAGTVFELCGGRFWLGWHPSAQVHLVSRRHDPIAAELEVTASGLRVRPMKWTSAAPPPKLAAELYPDGKSFLLHHGGGFEQAGVALHYAERRDGRFYPQGEPPVRIAAPGLDIIGHPSVRRAMQWRLEALPGGARSEHAPWLVRLRAGVVEREHVAAAVGGATPGLVGPAGAVAAVEIGVALKRLGGIPLTAPFVLLGRDEAAGVALPDEPSVSGVHADLHARGGRYHLFNWSLSNGTTVNGREVETAVLTHGDEISLGDCRLVYVEPAKGRLPAPAPPSSGAQSDHGVKKT